ncbi:hypothetical protein PSHT_11509 [Puccinia striiformis]|uniref:Uncharacterized protein n=1 Tax=Puccinia striiformis TaxID=27350 RepID=A0A2S4V2X8_9BASI|nr:hypothetical protein PSHT_11509 [Puccinia striiformis]
MPPSPVREVCRSGAGGMAPWTTFTSCSAHCKHSGTARTGQSQDLLDCVRTRSPSLDSSGTKGRGGGVLGPNGGELVFQRRGTRRWRGDLS